jgi:L-threonylcarbamoyladenylate synthase
LVTTPSQVALAAAIGALQEGEVVAIPTDTVYGLAASTVHREALDRIFELKGRPPDLALPVLVAELGQAFEFLGREDHRLGRIAERFWPGPLTVVVRATARSTAGLGGDGATVGLRCPADPTVAAICEAIGPIAVTSANRHGGPPASTAEEVRAVFGGDLPEVLDGGRRGGRPSTIVSIAGEPRLLREGPIAFEEVVGVVGAGQSP